MTRYLLIEDERIIYDEMKRMMDMLRPDYILAGWATGVEQAVVLIEGGNIDLILADVRLSDGLCFDIFSRVSVDIPIIFITAYDEYAIKAFKVNGIDYLLKPVDESDLDAALCRYEHRQLTLSSSPDIDKLADDYTGRTCKSRFSVQVGDSCMSIAVADVAYFFSEDKYTYLCQFSGKRYIVNYTLEQLEKLLDTDMFFRVSRNCILNIGSFQKSTRYFGGRLKLYVEPEFHGDIMVSRSRVNDFLKWIDGAL